MKYPLFKASIDVNPALREIESVLQSGSRSGQIYKRLRGVSRIKEFGADELLHQRVNHSF
jgi:hypothetical protein